MTLKVNVFLYEGCSEDVSRMKLEAKHQAMQDLIQGWSKKRVNEKPNWNVIPFTYQDMGQSFCVQRQVPGYILFAFQSDGEKEADFKLRIEESIREILNESKNEKWDVNGLRYVKHYYERIEVIKNQDLWML